MSLWCHDCSNSGLIKMFERSWLMLAIPPRHPAAVLQYAHSAPCAVPPVQRAALIQSTIHNCRCIITFQAVYAAASGSSNPPASHPVRVQGPRRVQAAEVSGRERGPRHGRRRARCRGPGLHVRVQGRRSGVGDGGSRFRLPQGAKLAEP